MKRGNEKGRELTDCLMRDSSEAIAAVWVIVNTFIARKVKLDSTLLASEAVKQITNMKQKVMNDDKRRTNHLRCQRDSQQRSFSFS